MLALYAMALCLSVTDNHASTPPLSFLQAGCPSCRPTNSVKALKAPGSTPAGVPNAGRNHMSYRMAPISMTLSDLERRFSCF